MIGLPLVRYIVIRNNGIDARDQIGEPGVTASSALPVAIDLHVGAHAARLISRIEMGQRMTDVVSVFGIRTQVVIDLLVGVCLGRCR